MALLTKEDILRGLRKLDAKARSAGVIVDMAVYGGAAPALVFDLRLATRDVDAVVHGSQEFLRRAVAEVSACIPPKVRFGVEEIMDRVLAGRKQRGLG